MTVPIYSGSKISGTRTETYYEADGDETLEPTTEIIKYVECTISPFDNSVILEAFGIDTSAQYPQFNLTYGEVSQTECSCDRYRCPVQAFPALWTPLFHRRQATPFAQYDTAAEGIHQR